MLPEKPWKADAILRLLARVLICMFMGTLLAGAITALGMGEGVHSASRAVLFLTALALLAGALWVLGRQWQPQNFGRKLVLVLVCFYGALTLSAFASHLGGGARAEASPWQVVIFVCSFQGAAFVLVHGFLRDHQMGWVESFGLGRNWNRALMAGCASGLILVPVGWVLQSGAMAVMERLHFTVHEQEAVEVLRGTAGWGGRVLLGFAAILLAPLGEELLFRGILYPVLRQRGYRWLAWWGTSLFFAGIHLNLVSFVPLTILALCLTWLYDRTGNLLAPVAAHIAFNALNFAAFFLGQSFNPGVASG